MTEATDHRFTQAVHACVERLLDERDHITVDETAIYLMENYPDAVADKREQLIVNAVKQRVRKVLRDLSDESTSSASSQLSLPDLHLPASIAVPSDAGDYYYVRADKARWTDLQAGEAEREKNLERAQQRLDEYRRALDRLRPYMEESPRMTVAGAIRRINRDTGQES